MADEWANNYMENWRFESTFRETRHDLTRHSYFRDKPLVLSGENSKVIEFLQNSMNALGAAGKLGADYKPLEVTGKSSPEFVEAFKNYLAIKRADPTQDFQKMPDFQKISDLTPFHLAGMVDTLMREKVFKKDDLPLQVGLLGALKEINPSEVKTAIELLEAQLEKQGYKIEKKAEASNDQTFLLVSGTTPIKPV